MHPVLTDSSTIASFFFFGIIVDSYLGGGVGAPNKQPRTQSKPTTPTSAGGYGPGAPVVGPPRARTRAATGALGNHHMCSGTQGECHAPPRPGLCRVGWRGSMRRHAVAGHSSLRESRQRSVRRRPLAGSGGSPSRRPAEGPDDLSDDYYCVGAAPSLLLC